VVLEVIAGPPAQADQRPQVSRLTKSASVRLENVCKTIGRTQVLAGVDLEIGAGEFVTLLGPSGSGKTSTLMAIAGFVVPDSGRIIVSDRDVTHVPPGRERDMGIVFQNYALFPHMSVAKNVAYPLRVRGVSRQETQARVAKVLELVQLGALADRKPSRLSGGQQQRVALARALVFEPSVLLMDEPMGALDVRLKQELQWEIRQLQRSIGATVIYVTHDQSEAMLLSDRVALLRDGKVEQYGRPQDLYRTPRSIFTARFLGESNLIFGQYRAGPTPGLYASSTGTVLRGASIPHDSGQGADYAALLRPEALSICSAAARSLPSNNGPEDMVSVEGHVQEAVFMGQAIRYVVKSNALAEPLIVQQAVRAGTEELQPGSHVRVSWDVADVHFIPVGKNGDALAA
jgi:putative spermidine/putrescine transport system ATP-binding protein